MAGKYKTMAVKLKKHGEVKVYASPRVGDALKEITENMDIYHGVRLVQVLEAIYAQGLKDGARRVFEGIDKSLVSVKKAIPYRPPGRPKKG
jgi:sulfate adenylyltransferase subunit 1 (EFTu-like GTPase family)